MNTKILLFFLAVAFHVSSVCAQPTQFIAASDSSVQYFGRIDDSNPDTIAFAFPGVSIKANFTGTAISAVFLQNSGGGETTTNYFTVIVDEQEPVSIAITPSQTLYSLAEGLLEGVHSIEIFKRTESLVGTVTFQGFYVDEGHSLVAPDVLPNTRIEFIGNSITCGYGNESSQSTPKSGFSSVNENNYMAWGAITARNLSAQYSCVAYSGRGLYQNNDGTTSGTLPKIYDHGIADNASVIWDNTRYIPDIVVINLGTNDFSAEVSSAVYTVDSTIFVDTYIAFIEKLRGYYANATIICALGVMMSDYYPVGAEHWTRIQSYTSAVVNHFTNLGDERVHYFKMNPQTAPYGEDWHPTIYTHNAMARALTTFIRSIDADTTCNGGVNLGDDVNVFGMDFPLTIDTQEDEHADVSYTWYKDGLKIDAANQPYVSCTDLETAIGQYRVVKDSANCVYQDKIMVFEQEPSVIFENTSFNSIHLSSDDLYTYTILSDNEIIHSIALYTISSTCVLKKLRVSQNQVVVNLSDMQRGVYIIQVCTDTHVYYEKIIRL